MLGVVTRYLLQQKWLLIRAVMRFIFRKSSLIYLFDEGLREKERERVHKQAEKQALH